MNCGTRLYCGALSSGTQKDPNGFFMNTSRAEGFQSLP